MSHPLPSGRKPFWRSLVFWAGIPGLFLLIWGWLGFIHDNPELSWVKGGKRWAIGGGDGSYWLEQSSFPLHYDGFREGLSFSRGENHWDGTGVALGKAFASLSDGNEEFRWKGITIGCWATVILYLGVWTSIVVWRRQRGQTRGTGEKSGDLASGKE